jgi:2-polyprenyl-3-methyl-5-hydroxy-6-metoxy-1,4-benzoquinol methylase
MTPELTLQQSIQEAEYKFPYHYLDIESDRHRLIDFVPTMSRYRLVRSRLGNVAGKAILDAGCGDGRFCYEWRDSGAELVGVDFSARAIAFAKAFAPEATFFCQSIADLDMAGRFDGAVCIETLEHIPPAEIPGFVAHLAAALKPGAKLIATVPSTNRPCGGKHYQHFTAESLTSVLSPYLDVEQVDGYGVLPDVRLRLRKRLAKLAFSQRRKRGWGANLILTYGDWYHRHYGEGPPERCRGIVATAVKP